MMGIPFASDLMNFVIFCYVAHHFYAKQQEKKQTSL
jgi:hypothetical protein